MAPNGGVPAWTVNVLPTFTGPIIVGVGADAINANVTAAVGSLVFVCEVYPLRAPVTFTVICLPTMLVPVSGNIYVANVAPGITTSSAYQAYVSVATGAHATVAAVNVEPSAADPVIVGVDAVVNTPEATSTVSALVFVVGSYVANVPFTSTDITAPRSAAVNTYVANVAPVIIEPLRFH